MFCISGQAYAFQLETVSDIIRQIMSELSGRHFDASVHGVVRHEFHRPAGTSNFCKPFCEHMIKYMKRQTLLEKKNLDSSQYLL